MTKRPIVMVARTVWYYSAGDEDAFFSWLDRIACIEGYKGFGRNLPSSSRREIAIGSATLRRSGTNPYSALRHAVDRPLVW